MSPINDTYFIPFNEFKDWHLNKVLHLLWQEGFWFHHAEPNYLMLVYWIPQSAHTFPANATHRVGIGAVVMNENNEVCY